MPSNLRRAATLLVSIVASIVMVLGAVPAGAVGANPVVGTWRLAAGFYALAPGLGAMWAVNADEFSYARVYRIDPTSGDLTLVTTLPFPAGGLTVADGSLWITDYFGNAVWRLAADGTVLAAIRTGLQPQSVMAAFGSIWTSDHHGASLTRIDPASDAVVATIPVGRQRTFRDGPQDLTHDGTWVYVGSSNLFRLQRVDPATDAVSTPDHRSGQDQFCGDLQPVRGRVWSVDQCSGLTYQLDRTGSVRQVTDPAPGADLTLAALSGSLWVGTDRTFDRDSGVGSDAALVERDPVSGLVERMVAIGGDASTISAGFGDLWVFDGGRHTIRRVSI